MKVYMEKISKESAEHYKWGNNCDGWRLLNLTEVSIIQESMQPGTSEKEHYHKIAKQFFFILEGQASIEAGGKIYGLKKHEGIEIKPGINHRFFNSSDKTIEFIVTSVPSTPNDRYDAV
jgi:mannose-6-phosphate isomerase-like protein (cupin superfamily)